MRGRNMKQSVKYSTESPGQNGYKKFNLYTHQSYSETTQIKPILKCKSMRLPHPKVILDFLRLAGIGMNMEPILTASKSVGILYSLHGLHTIFCLKFIELRTRSLESWSKKYKKCLAWSVGPRICALLLLLFLKICKHSLLRLQYFPKGDILKCMRKIRVFKVKVWPWLLNQRY